MEKCRRQQQLFNHRFFIYWCLEFQKALKNHLYLMQIIDVMENWYTNNYELQYLNHYTWLIWKTMLNQLHDHNYSLTLFSLQASEKFNLVFVFGWPFVKILEGFTKMVKGNALIKHNTRKNHVNIILYIFLHE